MKKLTSSLFVTAVLFFNTSYCKYDWVGLDLSQTDITNCVNFQLTRGGNCTGEFDKVTNILNKFIANKYSTERLNEVLGNPSAIIDNKKMVYYLTDKTNGSKVVLTTEKDILISYSVEGGDIK